LFLIKLLQNHGVAIIGHEKALYFLMLKKQDKQFAKNADNNMQFTISYK